MNKLSFAIVVAMTITACGGSGGSGSTQTSNITKISSANAAQITKSVNSSVVDMNLMQGMTLDYSQQIATTTNAHFNVETQKSAAVTRTIYCGATPETDSSNGLIDMSYDFTLTSISVDFAFLQCQYSETVYINGDYSLDVQGNIIDIAAGNTSSGIRFTSTVTDLNVVDSEGGTDTRLDGTWSHELVQNDLGYQLDFTADVSLATTASTKELVNWQQLTLINTSLSQLNVDITGQFRSSEITGTLRVTTIESLLYQLPENPQNGNSPSILSGQFKITAADGSSVLVTIVDSENAQLDIDTDGDGVIDVTRIVALSELGIDDLIPDDSLMN